jgi:hypothetical protein
MVRYLHQCGIEILGMPSLIVKLFVLYVHSAMANRYHVRQQRIFSFQSTKTTTTTKNQTNQMKAQSKKKSRQKQKKQKKTKI